MKFSEKLIYARAQLNITQAQLSNHLRVSFSTINRWETEKTRPTKKSIMAFEIFCKSHKILFENEDKK